MFSDMSVQGEGSPSSLLRRPVSEEQAPPPLERAQASYSPRCQRFRLEEGRKYDRQYAGIYAARLAQMRPALAERARRAWGEGVPVRTLCDLRRGERCCVVGTLFKRMELQPSVLKEEEEERGLLRRPPRRSKYVSDTDRLLLEDERQRIALKGNVDKHRCVTGSVIAVYGADENGDGTFTVEDYRAADLPPQTPIPSSSSSPRGIDRFVLLASGLGVGHNHGHNGKLALQLLVDTVTGQLGGRGEQSTAAAIVRVLLAGNLISHDGSRGDEEEEAAAASKPRYLSKKTQAGSVGAMRQLDELLLQLVTSVPVDVMPGRHDPTDYTLPQQPLHRLMLPRSSVYPTLRLVSNPYQAAIGGVTFLGTSGQNVSDIRSCSSLDDPLDILESTLRLRHVAPTAPDTLACYPFHRTDPFVVDECPHVYFSGNAPSFRSRAVRGPDGQEVLLVAVPEFRSTQTACLVNLRTLHCEPISFSAFSDDA